MLSQCNEQRRHGIHNNRKITLYHLSYSLQKIDCWLVVKDAVSTEKTAISYWYRPFCEILSLFFSDILWIIKRALRLHKTFTRIDRKSDNSVTGRKNCILNFEVWTWTWTWFEWVSWRARQWGMLTNLHNYQHGKIWLSFAVHGNLLPDSTEWGVSLEFHHRRLRIFSIFLFDYRRKESLTNRFIQDSWFQMQSFRGVFRSDISSPSF